MERSNFLGRQKASQKNKNLYDRHLLNGVLLSCTALTQAFFNHIDELIMSCKFVEKKMSGKFVKKDC
jgi:hypothetical protein